MATQTSMLGYHGRRGPLLPMREERQQWIQEVAYFKALERGFAPGHELDDWRTAEQEVDEVFRRFSDT